MILELITTIIAIGLIVPLLGFVFVYDKGSNLGKKRVYPLGKGVWRNSSEGKTIIANKLVIAAFVALVITARVFPELPGLEWLKLIVYASATLVFWMMFINLEKVYKDEDEEGK